VDLEIEMAAKKSTPEATIEVPANIASDGPVQKHKCSDAGLLFDVTINHDTGEFVEIEIHQDDGPSKTLRGSQFSAEFNAPHNVFTYLTKFKGEPHTIVCSSR
jgi:hypothetical protein